MNHLIAGAKLFGFLVPTENWLFCWFCVSKKIKIKHGK